MFYLSLKIYIGLVWIGYNKTSSTRCIILCTLLLTTSRYCMSILSTHFFQRNIRTIVCVWFFNLLLWHLYSFPFREFYVDSFTKPNLEPAKAKGAFDWHNISKIWAIVYHLGSKWLPITLALFISIIEKLYTCTCKYYTEYIYFNYVMIMSWHQWFITLWNITTTTHYPKTIDKT